MRTPMVCRVNALEQDLEQALCDFNKRYLFGAPLLDRGSSGGSSVAPSEMPRSIFADDLGQRGGV